MALTSRLLYELKPQDPFSISAAVWLLLTPIAKGPMPLDEWA